MGIQTVDRIMSKTHSVNNNKVKVKVTLEQATKAQRGSRLLLYSSFNLGARWGWVVNATPPAALPPGKDPVPIV